LDKIICLGSFEEILNQMKNLLLIISTLFALYVYSQPTNIYQPNGSTTNFGKVAADSLNYYVVNYPALTLMKIDGSNNATQLTTLTADPFQTMIWNNGKGIYPVANGSPFKLFDGTNQIDITGGQLPMAGYTGDKVILSDYFHRGNFTYFRTSDKIFKTDYTSAASIQTLAVGSISEMQHTTNSIFYWSAGLNRIDLITGNITLIYTPTSGSPDYGVVYNNEYYYCTPYGPASLGASSIYKVSDNGTITTLYTETASNKNLLRIIGVTPNGVIAIMATTSTGMEYVSISGGVATSLNFNTVANSRPCGNVGVGTSRTTNSLVYFVTLDTLYTVNSNNKALWVTDGTLTGTKKVFGGTPTTFAADGLTTQFIGSAEHCENDLYFNGKNGANAERLIYVNGSNYNVTTYPIGSGVTTQPSIRKTSSGIVLIAAPSPTSSSAKAVYKVNCGLLNGVDENGTQHTFFSLYPNPNNGNFNILNENTEKELSLDIYNLLGEKVYYQGITEQNSVLNLNLKSGVYFVNVIDKKGNKAVQKIIVQ